MAERDGGEDRLSDGHGELVEGRADPAGGEVRGEFIVAAAEVLGERVPGGDDRADLWRFSPRIGRGCAINRPWSASTELFA